MPPLQGRTERAGAFRRSGTWASARLSAIWAAISWPVRPGAATIQSSAKGLSAVRPPARAPASTSTGARPSLASQTAQEAPAGPAPTMTAS